MDKNEQIRQSGSTTRLKRKNQQCKTFRFKVDKSHMRADQLECIKMMFVECKRLYNYILGTGNIPNPKDYKQYKHITYLDKDKNIINYELSYIGSSIIQDQIRFSSNVLFEKRKPQRPLVVLVVHCNSNVILYITLSTVYSSK